MDVEGQMSPGELGNQGILGHEEGGPEYVHGILQVDGGQQGTGELRGQGQVTEGADWWA